MVRSSMPPLKGAIIDSISLMEKVTRTETGKFSAVTLPGHLVQIAIEGEVEQRAGGVIEKIRPGYAIWYHENEPVQGIIRKVPWTFYTVNFEAPSLLPP